MTCPLQFCLSPRVSPRGDTPLFRLTLIYQWFLRLCPLHLIPDSRPLSLPEPSPHGYGSWLRSRSAQRTSPAARPPHGVLALTARGGSHKRGHTNRWENNKPSRLRLIQRVKEKGARGVPTPNPRRSASPWGNKSGYYDRAIFHKLLFLAKDTRGLSQWRQIISDPCSMFVQKLPLESEVRKKYG